MTSIKQQGIFAEAGPLSVFVSNRVGLFSCTGQKKKKRLKIVKQLSSDMKYNPNATPVQYSNSQGDVIEKGSVVRVQIMGLRTDVASMHAVGKMSMAWFG